MALGSFALSVLPATLGIPGYVGALVAITVGYALFQTANNTVVMKDVPQDRRGMMSGMLTLSRNLGLVTGASAMGAVFAWASAAADVSTARPEAVALGMRTTFAIAAALILVARLSLQRPARPSRCARYALVIRPDTVRTHMHPNIKGKAVRDRTASLFIPQDRLEIPSASRRMGGSNKKSEARIART